MTLPSRRKRPTTAPAPNTPAPTAYSLAVAAVLLLGGLAVAGTPWAVEKTQPAAAPPSPAGGVMQTQYSPPDGGPAAADESLTVPPGAEKLFELKSEASLLDQMRNQERSKGGKTPLVFPPESVLTNEKYYGRDWPRTVCYAEPNFVVYRRLFFEQVNYERYGWDFGALTTVLSAGEFFGDTLLFPYHAFSDPFRCHEASAGYCLPGDPVPYLLYPHEVSATGAVAEAASVVTVLAVFP
jgi:hypothetical protein